MMLPKYRNPRGYILLPVLALLTLLGLFAYMLNRTGGMEARIADSLAREIQARYIAEAGMRHAKWFLASDCNFRTTMSNFPFGSGHSYTVSLTEVMDNKNLPTGIIHMVATGVGNGQNLDPATHYSEVIVDDYRCLEQEKKALYWSDWGEKVIRRAELDGSGVKNLLTAANGLLLPHPLAVDQTHRQIYWGDGHLIYRAGVDGSFMTEIIDCLTCEVSGLDLDPAANTLYYSDRVNNLVAKAGLDGSNPTVLINALLSQPGSIRVDPTNGRFYFADEGNYALKSANLDGSGQGTVLTGVQASALALDPVANLIYHFDRNGKNINRVDYLGANLTPLVAIGGAAEVNGLDYDPVTSLLHWTRTDYQRLQQANLDGSGVKDPVLSGAASKPWAVRLGPAQAIILPRSKGPFWTEDQGANKKVVRRAEVDGSNLQTLVSAQKETGSIKFDASASQLFWSGDRAIMNSSANGANLTAVLDCVVSGSCASVFGLALDPSNRLIYWVDQVNQSIGRIGYDGSNQILLLTGLNKPWDLDLDLVHGKIYWCDEGTKSLSSANLDGSNVQVVLADSASAPLKQPYSLAVDGSNSWLYWFDNKTSAIYRATLSGSGVATLVTAPNVTEARALALDPDGGKLYWSETKKKSINRANFDGSAVEVVIDLNAESKKPPWGLTIVPGTF